MNIRPARPDDADAISRVNVETWRDAYAGILPDRVLVNVSISREKGGWSSTLLIRYRFYIAEPENYGIVGFAVVGHNDFRISIAKSRYMRFIFPLIFKEEALVRV